ncbi:MAG: hypothetical protein AAB920_01815 [Patescibacteria group bacterium]
MKQIVIVLGIILAVLSFIYGAALPFMKAGAYISAMGNLQKVRSLQGFKDNFDAVFNFYSPVGTEEITKFLANDIVNLVSQEQQPEAVSRELVAYIEPHLEKNNPRHLMSGAQMRMILWLRYQKKDDYMRTEAYYKQILSFGPKLPPALYGLFELYSRAGDKENMRKVGETILSYWPSDTNIRGLIQK